MKTRRLIAAIVASSISTALSAAPYIVSDPYPTTGTQPDTCKAVEGTKTYESPVGKNADGTVFCHIDLAGAPNGSHAMQVYAVSTLWGSSTAVPFSFVAGAPALPASLKLAPQ